MPKRPEAYMNERREQILDATERCVLREGWDRTTLDGIAREASLSKGAVYGHYPSKRDLLVGLIERNRARIDQLGRGPGLAALRRIVDGDLAVGSSDAGHHIGVLELYLVAARDAEIKPMLGETYIRTIDALTAMVDGGCPHLGARAARQWTIEFLAMLRGVGVMQAAGAGLAEAEVREMFDRHFARLEPA